MRSLRSSLLVHFVSGSFLDSLLSSFLSLSWTIFFFHNILSQWCSAQAQGTFKRTRLNSQKLWCKINFSSRTDCIRYLGHSGEKILNQFPWWPTSLIILHLATLCSWLCDLVFKTPILTKYNTSIWFLPHHVSKCFGKTLTVKWMNYE